MVPSVRVSVFYYRYAHRMLITACTDVNECDEDIHNCHESATCSDVVGGFNCICNTGFTGDGILCVSKWLYRYIHKNILEW